MTSQGVQVSRGALLVDDAESVAAPARAVDHRPQRAVLLRGVQRRLHGVGIGHVGRDEAGRRPEPLGRLLTRRIRQVYQHHAGAALGEQAGGGEAEAGGTAGDQGGQSFDAHARSLSSKAE